MEAEICSDAPAARSGGPAPSRPGLVPLALSGAGLLVLLLAGCGGPFPQSTLDPASDFATRIDDLFRSIFWWAVLVFVVVEGLLVFVLVRFRMKDPEERPEPVHGNVLLEIGWTLAPAIILVFIAVPTIETIWSVDRPPEDPDALRVEVIGHQWWWEFRYPELGIQTANELHVPVGRTVDLRLRSDDVIHSFWVPRLGGKRDLVPGHETGLWFTVDSAGTYLGQCAEYCGTSHALMKMLVVAQEPEEFRRWVERQGRPVEPPRTDLARSGRDKFLNSACISCHRVEGTRAQGEIGPDLTHFGSRRTIAAGILENNRENLRLWLEKTDSIKPGNLMQFPEMDEQTIREIAAYLESLE